MSAVDVEALVLKFFRHVTSGELTSAMALMTEDAVLVEPEDLPFGGVYQGREGLINFARSIPRSIRVDAGLSGMQATDDAATVRLSLTFTCRRTGRTTQTEGVELYRIKDGAIARVDVFYGSVLKVRELIEGSQAT